MQNVYKMFVYKMYYTFHSFVSILYTKFSCHSSFNFVFKMYKKVCRKRIYIFYTFCIHFVYISYCIHLVQPLYTKCINSFRVGKYLYQTNIGRSGELELALHHKLQTHINDLISDMSLIAIKE